jgi:RNA polymerase sigma-70 factor (ECF subfamily)
MVVMEAVMDPSGAGEEIDRAVLRVRAGDRDAYRTVVAACEARLRIQVAAILPQVAAVEDVVQKTLVIGFFRLDQYRIGTSFMGWISTIARYQALNERRRWLSERSFKQRLKAERAIDLALYQNDEPGAFGHEPLFAQLGECLGALGEQAAAVVRCHYLEEQPIGEIAARYERSTDWVHLVLHRARRALRACLMAKQGAERHGH